MTATEHPAQTLGNFLRTHRKSQRISLLRAASAGRISPTQLCHLEIGTMPLPNAATFNHLLKSLGLNPTEKTLQNLITEAQKSGPISKETAFPTKKVLPAFLRLTPAETEQFQKIATTIPTWETHQLA